MDFKELVDALRDDSICDASDMLDYMSEAADLLEEQQERITELEKERRWIPVTERLPSEEGNVLVVVHGRCGNTEFCGAYMLADFDPGNGWMLDSYPDAKDFAITHWMPLPEGPKEEQ